MNPRYGFSLLEMLLVLGLVAIVLGATHETLIAHLGRDIWWRHLQAMVVSQQMVQRTFDSMFDNACRFTITDANVSGWRMNRGVGSGCQTNDIRYRTDTAFWQKRRLGGRFASFLANTRLVRIHYGVAETGQCFVQRWVGNDEDLVNEHIVALDMLLAVGIHDTSQREALPVTWYAMPHPSSGAGGQRWLWEDISVVRALPCG